MGMLKLKTRGQLTFEGGAATEAYPVFVTPDEIRERPFLFSRELHLSMVRFDQEGQGKIACSVQTSSPLEHPLLSGFSSKVTMDRYYAWWDRWNMQQQDNRFLGHTPEDLNVLCYNLEVLLGHVFVEPDYSKASN